ncbi:uncharacterized protein [Rutidosis leptorrhynchoides]|uniref:uncharacterized protein n=1 Tax=Rutidosis leptorrhynchoides TaxID=125765 RepID=UPI003A993606
MSDDIPIQTAATLHMSKITINSDDLESYVLYELQILLTEHSRNVTDFGLPAVPQNLLDDLHNRLIMEERNYDREALSNEKTILLTQLNQKQRTVYDAVMNSNANQKQELIFVYGHGGTGKTFLWKTLTTSLRAEGKIVLAVASSGIASLFLPSGQTAHSRFRIPIDITDESVCNIKKKTHMATLLRKTELIIWDEVPMNNRKCLEELDRTLRDIFEKADTPFGGLSFVLGGDFRQTLPVIKGCGKVEILDASITHSPLWNHFHIITLEENMRLQQPNLSEIDKENIRLFANWLLQIGNGTIGEPDECDPHNTSWVKIPNQYCIRDDEDGLTNLISFIYSDKLLYHPNPLQLQQQAIVCPKNETADAINEAILIRIEKESKTYTSYDSATPYSNDGGQTEMEHETEVVPISALRPGDRLKAIEVIVYRQWVIKRPKTRKPAGFCTLLLDIHGNAIQAISDFSQKRHFTEVVQINSAFRLSNFICR